MDGKSLASRCQIFLRNGIFVAAESTPSNFTPRKMNGNTEVCNSTPPALPKLAMAPSCCMVRVKPRQCLATYRIQRSSPQCFFQRTLIVMDRYRCAIEFRLRQVYFRYRVRRLCRSVPPRGSQVATAFEWPRLPTPPVAPVTITLPLSGVKFVLFQTMYRQCCSESRRT